MARRQKPIRVAIVGGGCAAITTAWELTNPTLQGRFEVTVYQMGWRLGGKGASGRGRHNRIEEHGLHLWMGHYDNAFRVIRECYRELNRDPTQCPIADWTDAFVPDPYVGLADRDARGRWRQLMAYFPPMSGLPGDPRSHPGLPTVGEFIARAVELLGALIPAALNVDAAATDGSEAEPLERVIDRFLRYGQVAGLTAVLAGLNAIRMIVARSGTSRTKQLEQLLDPLVEAIHRVTEPLLSKDSESQYLWEIIDVTLAAVRGAIRFGLHTSPQGFDAINEYDAREWLRENGAASRSMNSTFVRGLYDLAFAYEDGDPARPRMAAGQGLRGGMRMFFAYRGALFWKMQGGMGDIVFGPLYEVLKRRGVTFRFFHKLENVRIDNSDGAEHVAGLDFNVQARTTDDKEYEPLIDVGGLPCWPAEPLWEQLADGERLKEAGTQFESAWDHTSAERQSLSVKKDFDFVVLGVSIGVIPMVCREILKRDKRWRSMVRHVKTVPTQCFQLWLNRDLSELGWEGNPANVSSFVEPFDTWADMSHLAQAEMWPTPPGAISYFCNVLPCKPISLEDLDDPLYPRRQHARVRKNAIRFLDRDVVHLWPGAQKKNRFRWKHLAHGTVIPGDLEHPFDSQFWIANVNPTDQYVLSLPGTIQHRISPLDITYDNLTIAGDWTDCGFNFGCVEAAVISGRLAAHALSGFPRLEDIDGYDHP